MSYASRAALIERRKKILHEWTVLHPEGLTAANLQEAKKFFRQREREIKQAAGGLAEPPAKTYRCEECGGEFESEDGWTEEEARTEQATNGWGGLSPEDVATVCDDCYKKIMARMN